jgi:hypothetical protein
MKPIILSIAFLTGGMACAQSRIVSEEPGERVRLLTYDESVLDMQEPRTDLACSVSSFKPELGFDFLFHAGYRITIPVKELPSAGDMLTVVLRVRSDRRPDDPVYLLQKIRIPKMGAESGGTASVDGFFEVGGGKYHIDWMMRDGRERVCARFWSIEAKASGKDASLDPELAQDLIQPAESTPFHEDPATESRQTGGPLNVKVIVNFATRNQDAATLGANDLEGLAAILRKIGREPRVGSFSVVACSVQAGKILYRQQDVPRIDLPALGQALKSLNLASVDAKYLAVKNGETEFLAQLITDETQDNRMDALIFVSPKYPVDTHVSKETVEHIKELDRPVFYLNYNLNPVNYPWRDQIGRLVKQLHGFEYTISRPSDLFNAWSDIVARLVDVKQTTPRTGN